MWDHTTFSNKQLGIADGTCGILKLEFLCYRLLKDQDNKKLLQALIDELYHFFKIHKHIPYNIGKLFEDFLAEEIITDKDLIDWLNSAHNSTDPRILLWFFSIYNLISSTTISAGSEDAANNKTVVLLAAAADIFPSSLFEEMWRLLKGNTMRSFNNYQDDKLLERVFIHTSKRFQLEAIAEGWRSF